MLQYGAYQRAGDIAERVAGLPGQATGAAIGAAKIGAKVAGGIGRLFGGGKPDTTPSGTNPNPTSSAMNYYSRDTK